MSSPAQENRLLTDSLSRAVIRLAVPVSVGMLLESALYLTEFFWIGRLGTAAQDAAATVLVVQWTLFTTFSIITVGQMAMTARGIGAGDLRRAQAVTEQSLWLGIGLGLLFLVAGLPTTEAVLSFMEASPDVIRLATPLLSIWLVCAAAFVLIEVLFTAFRAVGDTTTPAMVGGGVVVLNLGLTPLLMFGWGPFPAFGMNGAAIATCGSVITGLGVMSWLTMKGRLGFPVRLRLDSWKPIGEIARLVTISVPITAQQLSFVVVYWFLIRVVHQFGPPAAAAMGIGNRIESISYLTCHGFSVAAATLVGQNLGAGKPYRAAGAAWTATGYAVGATALSGLLFWGFADQIAGLFTADPAVREIASAYLVILAISQFAMAVEIVIEGAFSGAGETLPPMLVLVPGALLRIPLAWWLAIECDWGTSGVWWTLTFTTILKAAVLSWWFSRNRWQHRII